MASIDLFYNKLLAHEGGYTVDTGGPTNLGITLDTWRQFGRDLDGDKDIDEDDVKLITPEIAAQVYKAQYWDKVKGDDIKSQIVAELLFDHAVNAGVSRAVKMIQWILKNHFHKDLGDPGIDGIVGKYTLSAINSVNPTELANLYKEFRTYYYRWLAGDKNVPPAIAEFFRDINLASDASVYGKYLKGWLNRVNSFIIKQGTSAIPLISLLAGSTLLYFLFRDK